MRWELEGFSGVEGLDMRICWGFWGKKMREWVGGRTHISEASVGHPANEGHLPP
jgi:hypothetical protein